jgi:phosphoribosylformylglycinamidine synthase
MEIKRLYRAVGEGVEHCYYIASRTVLTGDELRIVQGLLAEGFQLDTVTERSQLPDDAILEIGPRINIETPWSTNMVAICHASGLKNIVRLEFSRRHVIDNDRSADDIIDTHCDRMQEMVYEEPLRSFDTGIVPEDVYDVDMISGGPDALVGIPGISMDQWDREFYYDYFVVQKNRNPTIVEIMDLNNANSEHSRHGFFGGKQVIDDIEQEQTLFELVKDTLRHNPKGSVISFADNSSAIEGSSVTTLIPHEPGKPSGFSLKNVTHHPLLTAETHNFPTGVAPFPGAATGTGGRIRDVQGTGRGGEVIAGTAAYCVGNLNIPGYPLPWEEQLPIPVNLATPLQIEIEASNGASDYGNKFGEPVIAGFTRSFDLRLESGRWGFVKPIMFTAGVGQINDQITRKKDPTKGMIIVQIGGPAYRVGFGGGAASSMLQGQQDAQLDFNAVQRGDAEMEQKMNRVIRACNEMGSKTLIDVIHDQGAGGPANVLKELVEKSGGRIEIRRIRVGDPTMSVLEIYVAEFQERMGMLISPENITQFQEICEREKVYCEVLGEVTGDLHFVVTDENDGMIPVNMDLSKVLGGMPQKTFEDTRIIAKRTPLIIPQEETVHSALKKVMRLVSVGSKRFLTNKVDRAVTGLVAQQQCCGPLQMPISNVAVVAQSHFGLSGIATSIGEQPIKMLVDPRAGARMAVGEALTNLMWAQIRDLDQVKCSANWMWAPKLPGEGAALRDAVEAMSEAMKMIGIAVDGGKDSLSMATIIGEETVKSPRQLVVSLYGAMDDIYRVITPDIKRPGESELIFVDLADKKTRMGGSAFAHVHKQIGNESPDMNDPFLVRKAFLAVQELIAKDLILSGHDVSDGGLIVTLLEMAFAGNCGMYAIIDRYVDDEIVLSRLFAEELGFVVEVDFADVAEVGIILKKHDLDDFHTIGKTVNSEKKITVQYDGEYILSESMQDLRAIWEETSYQLDRLQASPQCVDSEKRVLYDRKGPSYHVPFDVRTTDPFLITMSEQEKPKVAILREEGSNSDREMTSAFYSAGFAPWDVTMSDLLTGRVDLADFRGLAAVGGFSYADVPESAKGWAATIKNNQKLWETFSHFIHERNDTFSLGICNGAQLFGLVGFVPWHGLSPHEQPRFVRNVSGRFESRWSTIKIMPSKAIMFTGMEGLTFGIHVDHGEGCLNPIDHVWNQMVKEKLIAACYVDDDNRPTNIYPYNPNGSRSGATAICSRDGRHLAMMPHPERVFLPWQCHWLPEGLKGILTNIGVTPWIRMFQNAYEWCMSN